MWRDRHMFEVEQIDYKKEQIGWSYISFNDNKIAPADLLLFVVDLPTSNMCMSRHIPPRGDGASHSFHTSYTLNRHCVLRPGLASLSGWNIELRRFYFAKHP